MKKVIIVGTGNIGRRYLEGILKTTTALDLILVDSSFDSRMKAIEIVSRENHKNKRISFHASIPTEIQEYDLAIISTTAKNRWELIQSMGSSIVIKNWIIEKLITDNSQDAIALSKYFELNKNVWVNYPRRTSKLYFAIKKMLSSNLPVHMEISGSKWNLISNSVHFIDVVQFLTDEKIIKIDISGIEKWIPSTRPGYYDIQGEILIFFDTGSTLLLKNTNLKDVVASMQIKLKQNENVLSIDEIRGILELNNVRVANDLALEYQSQITSNFVSKILEIEKCDLPDFGKSIESHLKYIIAVEQGWIKSSNGFRKELRVT